MAKAKQQEEEVVEEQGSRISITVDPSLRRNMRIAAALKNMTPGEWAVRVLTVAAEKATANIIVEGEDVG